MPKTLPANYFRRVLAPGVLALLVVLCLLPFVMLCWYAHASADDFLQATDVHKHGHWGYMAFMYMQWTGRYTSILLWGLFNPVSYAHPSPAYGVVCLLTVLALPVACYWLLRWLLPGQFSNRTLWLSGGVFAVLFLLQVPSTAEAFYWIVSNYNYTLPGLLTLLWLGVLGRHASAQSAAERRKWMVWAVLLAVVVIGGNETNALPMALGVTSFTALRCIQHRRIEWHYVWLSVAVVGACAAAFLAPGNFVRMGQGGRLYSVAECVSRAGVSARKSVVSWLGNGVLLALTVLLAPISYRLARVPGLPLNRLTQNPLFITFLIPASLLVVFFLAWSATSQNMPFRSRNILYLFFLVGWFLHAHGWARYAWRNATRPSIALPGYVQVLLVLWIAGVFSVGDTRTMRGHEPEDNTNNILLAYKDWLGGAAARYDAQLTARYEALRTEGWTPDNVVVEALQAPPRTILFGDISTNTYDWSNQAYAEFFGKKTIRVPE